MRKNPLRTLAWAREDIHEKFFADVMNRRPRGFYVGKLRRDLSFDPLQWLWNILSNVVNSHKPWFEYVLNIQEERSRLSRALYYISDILNFCDSADQDLFGITQEFRGWSWRGLDCNDDDNTVYPGT